jgi:hypothetical protein
MSLISLRIANSIMSDRDYDIPFLNREPQTLPLRTSFAIQSLVSLVVVVPRSAFVVTRRLA